MSNVNSSNSDQPVVTAVDMASIHAKLDSLLTNTNEKMNNLMYTSNATLKQLTDYIGANDVRVEALSTRINENDDLFARFESRLAALEGSKPAVVDPNAEHELQKQQQLKCSICFSGLPYVEGENIPRILNAIWFAIKVKVAPADIVNTHRTKPSKRSPGLICVKFATYEKKIEVMAAKRKTNLILTDLNLNLAPGERRLFANHQMTPYFSAIFYKARQAQANGTIMASWIGNYGLNMRLTDDSVKVVKSEAEFNSIIAAISPVDVHSSSDDGDDAESTVVEINNRPAVSTPLVSKTGRSKKNKRSPVVRLTRMNKRRLGDDSPTNNGPSTSSGSIGGNSTSKIISDKKIKHK